MILNIKQFILNINLQVPINNSYVVVVIIKYYAIDALNVNLLIINCKK